MKMTGGAEIPPSAPVKVWTLSPEVAVLLATAVATAAPVEAEHSVATALLDTTSATLVAGGGATAAGAEQAQVFPAKAAVVTVAATLDAALDAALVAIAIPADIPATAADTSAAVASSTRRFSVKMQPTGSSVVSQELPLAVGSPI